jgi:hypothetical protein
MCHSIVRWQRETALGCAPAVGQSAYWNWRDRRGESLGDVRVGAGIRRWVFKIAKLRAAQQQIQLTSG